VERFPIFFFFIFLGISSSLEKKAKFIHTHTHIVMGGKSRLSKFTEAVRLSLRARGSILF
jgi:hypothetical protein